MLTSLNNKKDPANFNLAITIFILLFSIQQFDAWYLDPKLIGNKVGVRLLFIILGLAIGGGFFGVIGMLLASPTMATINVYYDEKVAIFKAKNSNLVKYIENGNLKSENIAKSNDEK